MFNEINLLAVMHVRCYTAHYGDRTKISDMNMH